MHALIRFSDNSHAVFHFQRLKNLGSAKYSVRYPNGGRYDCRVLCQHDDDQLLRELKRNINDGVPRVMLMNVAGDSITKYSNTATFTSETDFNANFSTNYISLSQLPSEGNDIKSARSTKKSVSEPDVNANFSIDCNLQLQYSDKANKSDSTSVVENSVHNEVLRDTESITTLAVDNTSIENIIDRSELLSDFDDNVLVEYTSQPENGCKGSELNFMDNVEPSIPNNNARDTSEPSAINDGLFENDIYTSQSTSESHRNFSKEPVDLPNYTDFTNDDSTNFENIHQVNTETVNSSPVPILVDNWKWNNIAFEVLESVISIESNEELEDSKTQLTNHPTNDSKYYESKTSSSIYKTVRKLPKIIEDRRIEPLVLKCTNSQTEADFQSKVDDEDSMKESETSDPDYKPHEDSNDSSEEGEDDPGNEPRQSIDSYKNNTQGSHNSSARINVSITRNPNHHRIPDDTEMYVTPFDSSKSRKRIKHFCPYCGKPQSQFSRHLERQHADESEVKKFVVLPPRNRERKKIIETMRRRGDFLYSFHSEHNDGQLIVCRRPKSESKRTAADYAVCPTCKGSITKNHLRHHFRICNNKKIPGTRQIFVLSRAVTGRIHEAASERLDKMIFPVMREDEVVRLIRYDELVIKYANKLCLNYRNARNDNSIRQQIRQLGRFLQEVKRLSPEITTFESIFSPKHYDLCITAVNNLAELLPCKTMYRKPGLASSLGTSLKKLAKFQANQCIKKEDKEKQSQAEDFLKLFAEDYGTDVNKTVVETQAHLQRQKNRVTLPTTEDISKLHDYLNTERQVASDSLREIFTYDSWLALAKSTMTTVQVFNRRRVGDVQRILIDEFETYTTLPTELLRTMSSEEQKIAKKYYRFLVRAKLNRTVPILLTKELVQCIELILQFRSKAKVSKTNPYIFGIPNKRKGQHEHLLAYNVMRDFSVACGADHPETLRGTTLRKQLATLCVRLDLTDNEVTDMANFMGHHKDIHKQIYRQDDGMTQILKLSKVLEIAQGEKTSNQKNGINHESGTSEDETSDTSPVNDTIEKTSPTSTHNRHTLSTEIQLGMGSEQTETEQSDNEPISHNSRRTQATNVKKKRSSSPRVIQCKRTRWSEAEKQLVINEYGSYPTGTFPSLNCIDQFRKKHAPTFDKRSSQVIKAWLSNQRK